MAGFSTTYCVNSPTPTSRREHKPGRCRRCRAGAGLLSMADESLMTQVPPQLIETLRRSREVTVLTGSGISAESGIPTFRDAQTGIWAKFRPEDLATPEAFARNPRRVWDWYAWRREMVSEAQPNPGHGALARMARILPRFNLITQNVDGLHQRAGSTDVIEYHGNIMRDLCSIEHIVVAQPAPGDDVPPRCPACGGMLRPDVVWFGEAIPAAALDAAQQAAERCDVFLSIGTSSLVYPAAGLMEIALRSGAILVEVNPSPTPVTKLAEFALSGTAGAILPQMSAALLDPA